jgi:transposase
LRDEHDYPGSYERVRQYLLAKGRSQRVTFIPLDQDPGQRLEADFGHIHVDFPDGRRLVPVLLTTWAYSNCPFAIALPTERTEAILHGLVEAFTFFACVPRELWWDNPKTVLPLCPWSSSMTTTRSAGQPRRSANCASAYCRSRDSRFSSTC